jgi:uncharacterized membrane protein required for colicin V production
VINWLDFCLILLMGLGVTIGYLQGMLRQVMNLAAMYLAAILAAQYYHVFGNYFKGQLVTTPGTMLNGVAFFIIIFAVTGLLNFLTYDAYKNTKLSLTPVLDRLGGMILGLVAAWILIALAINILDFATSTQSWTSADMVRQQLMDGIRGSVLAEATGATLPGILAAMKPWLPAGIPTIFNP